MRIIILLTVSIFLLITSCTKTQKVVSETKTPTLSKEEQLKKQADEIAQKYIITDGHVDLPYRLKISNFKLQKEYLGIPIQADEGDFDYERAKEGGLDAPFMSIYLPADLQKKPGASKALADSLIDMVSGIAIAHPDKFQIAKSADDCDRLFKKGIIALPMGMENGSGLEDNLSNVKYFKDRGISYITLTHSKVNLICDSSYDTTRTWQGLSPYGYQVVEEMNKRGIMVDISHVSDETFYDVMEFTKVPAIASHSSCRKFTPDFERNMSDAMIKALGRNGGVIQINFGSSFLSKKVQTELDEMRSALFKLLEEKGLSGNSEEGKTLIEEYRKKNPVLMADVKTVADHIDNVAKIAGINHVGLGSDYDGVGDTLPTGLKDVSQYPNLIKELLDRDYSEEDIAKICYKNVWRVWKAVDEYASQFE